jgi:hypothetical protein
MLPSWVARWDRMAQQKVKRDEAQVNRAERLLQKLMEQRRRGEAVRSKLLLFRDRTPAELGRQERPSREAKERGWIARRHEPFRPFP